MKFSPKPGERNAIRIAIEPGDRVGMVKASDGQLVSDIQVVPNSAAVTFTGLRVTEDTVVQWAIYDDADDLIVNPDHMGVTVCSPSDIVRLELELDIPVEIPAPPTPLPAPSSWFPIVLLLLALGLVWWPFFLLMWFLTKGS